MVAGNFFCNVLLLKANVEELNKTIENQALIYKAKKALMQSGRLSESAAFRKIQRRAMDKKKTMRQIAEAILIAEGWQTPKFMAPGIPADTGLRRFCSPAARPPQGGSALWCCRPGG